MKRLIAMILTVCMSVSVLMLAVSAEILTSDVEMNKIDSLVVLGDSISTGCTLEGTIYTRASYANHVAKALDLNFGTEYVNLAVDGYTSAQIFQKARENVKTVSEADLIIMTVGGNDVMWKMLAITMKAAGVNTFDLEQIAAAMMRTDPITMTAALYSAENVAIIDEAIATYRKNMTAMIEYLRQINPDARVLFLTQYNPTSGLTAFGVLQAYSEAVITRLNETMTEVVTAGGYEIVDTHAVMVGRGVELSNILSGDIHPNIYGHAMMAEKVKEHLNISNPTETTEETTVMTTTLPAVTTASPVTTTAKTEAVAVTTETSREETTAPEVSSETLTSSSVITSGEETDISDFSEKDAEPVSGEALSKPAVIGIVLVVAGAVIACVAIVLFKKH